MSDHLHRNPSTRDALRIAQRLGCAVYRNSANEIVVAHPMHRERQRLNYARKDCPRRLLSMLRQLGAKLGIDIEG